MCREVRSHLKRFIVRDVLIVVLFAQRHNFGFFLVLAFSHIVTDVAAYKEHSMLKSTAT